MADDNTQQQKSSAGAEIRQQLGLDKSYSQKVRASEKAARLRERDVIQYGNPNELGVRRVIGARIASGLERELTNVFGTRIGEALRSSRRAEPGQKYKEFKSSLMGSFASSLGRSGVIGQFLANKLREQREFAEDPTEEYQRIRENFEIVSGDMFNINARFKAIEDKLEDSDQSVSRIVQEQLKPINVRLDDTRKDLDQLKTQFNEFENTTFTRFQSTVTKDIVDLKGKVGKLLATSQHIQSSLQMMSEQQSGQPQSQPPSLLQTAAAGAGAAATAGAGRSALRGSLRYLKPLGRFAGVAGVGYAMYEALDSIGQMNQQRDKDIGITPGMSQEEISAIKKQANINRRKSGYNQLSEQTKQLKQQVATQPAQRSRARGLFGLGGFPQTDQPTIKYQPPSFDQYRQEREKSRFLQYGQLPEGFEFLPGNMGRLGQPEAVAARGAMPLGGYGEVAGVPGMPRGGYAGGGGNAAGTTAGPVANVGKESTSTGGGVLPNMPSLDPTKFVAGGIDRTKLYDQLMGDPDLRLRLFALSHREMGTPEGRADIMNTVMNRAMGRSGGNLRKELFDLSHYFGPHNRNPSETYRLEKEIARNPALYKQYEQSMMRLLYGEERVKGAYHQEGAPGYKERRMREFPQGHVGRGGEYYYNKPFEMDPSKLPRLSQERLEQLRKDPRFSGAIPAPGTATTPGATPGTTPAPAAQPQSPAAALTRMPIPTSTGTPTGVQQQTPAAPVRSFIEGYDPTKQYKGTGRVSEKYVNENFLPAMNFIGALGMGKAIGENPYIREGKFYENQQAGVAAGVHSQRGHHYGAHGFLASDISGGGYRPAFMKIAGGEKNARAMVSALGDLMFHPEIRKLLSPRELINQNRTVNARGYSMGGGHPSHVHFAPGAGISKETYEKLAKEILDNPEKFGQPGKNFANAAVSAGLWVKSPSGGYMLNPEKFPQAPIIGGMQSQPQEQSQTNLSVQQVVALPLQQREKIVSEVAAQHGVSEDAIRNKLAMQTEQEKKANEGTVDLATLVPPVAGADLGGYAPSQIEDTYPQLPTFFKPASPQKEPSFTIPTAQEREALDLEGVPPVPSEGPQIPEVPGIGPRQEPLPPELKPIPPPAPPDMADTGGYSPEQTATVAAQQEIAKQQEAATTTQPQAPAQTAGDASGGSPQFPRHHPESQQPSAGDGGKGSYGRCFV